MKTPQTQAERELLNALEDAIFQQCYLSDSSIDSMGISSYATGLRILADYGRVKITRDTARRVIAKRIVTPKETVAP